MTVFILEVSRFRLEDSISSIGTGYMVVDAKKVALLQGIRQMG